MLEQKKCLKIARFTNKDLQSNPFFRTCCATLMKWNTSNCAQFFTKRIWIVIYLLSSWSILIFGKLFFICFCPFPSIIPLDRGWGRGFGCRRFSVSGFSLGWAWGRSPFAAILGTILPSRPIKIRPFSINPIHPALHKGKFISRKTFCYLK